MSYFIWIFSILILSKNLDVILPIEIVFLKFYYDSYLSGMYLMLLYLINRIKHTQVIMHIESNNPYI